MKDPRTLLNKQVTQTTQPNTANKTGMKDPRTLPKSTTQMSSTPSQSPGINAFNILNNATKAQSYNDVNSINNNRSNIVTPSTNVPTFKTLEDAQKYANDNNIKVNSPTKEQVEKIEDKNKLTNLYKDKIKLPNQRMYKTPYQSITNTNYGIDEKTKKIIEESKPLAEGEKAWYEKIIKAPEIMKDNNRRFVDGYQFGDITQTALENIGDSILTIGGTVGDLALGAAKGFAGLGEKMANLPAAGIAQIADWTGNDEFANKLRTNIGNGTGKWLSPHIEKAQEAVDSASISAEYMDKTAETGGQVFGMVAGGKVLGTAGNIPIKLGTHTLNIPTLALLSGSGSGAEEAYSKENVSNVQAWTKIISSGLIEGFSEGLFGLLGVGGNDVTEELAKKAISKMSSGAGKVLTKLGVAGAGEASEEFISYALNWLVDNGITNNMGKGDFSTEWDWSEVGEQMALAFVSSGLTQGGSSMVGINRQTQVAIQSAEKTLNRPLTLQEQQSIRNQVIDYVLTDGEINTQEENKQELENNSSSINLQQNNQVQRQNDEVNLQQIEKQNNTNIVQNISNNENISQNNIQQSLGTEQVRNAEVTREIQTFVDNRNKISPGLSVEFDSTLNTDGVIEKRTDGTRIMKINPNSSRAYEFVAVHEMLHDLEGAKEQYQDLSSFVKERAMTHEDFEMAKSNLTEQYTKYYQENGLDMSNLNMENETVNDMVARALGNQDFLNELAGNKPNVFMRMYNWIKNVLLDGQNTGKTFRERRADNKYLQELKSKFEIAYNTAYKGKASQQYSIQVDSNGNKYVKVDTDQDIFEGKTLKEQKEIARKYILEKFREKGLMKDNQNINVTRKTANEYTNPKKFLDAKTISNKVKASTELDNMLNISKYKYSKPDDGRHVFAQNGWDYYETTFQVGNRTYTGLLNIAKSGNKKTLYDITNIKETNSKISVKTESVANSSLSNSIPSNSGAVNSQYMQDSPNNTQGLEKSSSFSLGDLEAFENKKQEAYKKIADEFGRGANFWEANLEGLEKESAIKMLKRDTGVQNRFIETHDFEKVYRPVSYRTLITAQTQNFVKENNVSFEELVNNEELTNKFFDVWGKELISMGDSLESAKQTINMWKDYFEAQRYKYSKKEGTMRILKSFESDFNKILSGATQEVDNFETSKKLEKMETFDKYVESFVNPLYGEKPKLSKEELTELAQDTFGITTDFSVGAYMTPDGKLLNFRDGRSQYRNDHRDIDTIGYNMQEFIDAGNIRMKPEGNGFELAEEPTAAQYDTLSKYIDSLDGEVYIEIDLGKNKYDGANYKKGTSTNKIISDLQYYFKSGKFPIKSQFADFRYSQSNDKWQSYLDKNWDLMPDSKKTFGFPTNEQLQAMDNKKIAEGVDTLNLKENKIKSLEDIADMTEDDLRNEKGVNYKHKKDKNTQYERKFFENVETSKIINQDIKDTIEITTYERQANEKTLAKANKKLDEQGDKLIKQWQNKTKNFTAEDVAIGAILIERYQQMGDTESAVNVVQKLADMGTEVGRTVQMYSIFQRLTPESMLIYQQRKLNDVFKEVSQRKTGEWVEANKEKFKLTADDSKFITEQVEKAQQATNERQKQIELAKIESRINDKLPPERGQTIKAVRRIAMLFNPKTQVRNVVGNALIMPVNDVADFIGTQIDKAIAKKTGIRTTNYANLKEKAKGFKKGITESIEDYKLGIRTEPTGSKYEFDFGGKAFDENTKSKALNYINNKMNGINNLLSAVMSGGDRPFYEAAFNNSLQGQMKANNVATPTSEMIDIAVNEALSRTWNDSNNYTQAVLGIRREMNKLNIGGFGLGDLIIPFAKTPANLTKAMVEYSPLGTIEAIIDYSDMKKAISRGEMTAQQQKNFVNSTSKAIAGSILYLIAGTLAKTGAITGSPDDDKDVRNFEQNVLGIQPYSIKIGDKTFTYSWANPLNAPLAIMADTYKMSKENASLFDILTNGFKTAGKVIADNSFLQGIKELFEADSISEGLTNAVINMPSQFIPTFLSQFATLGDENKRQTFEYGDKLKTTTNQIKTKIPKLKNTLAPVVNTFGEEVESYGGDNSIFNVFINPANVSEANATDTQKELYALYEVTKDKTIFPRQAPYYLSDDGEKINLSSHERAEYQKISGKYVSENLGALFDSEFYKTLENEQKVEVINEIVSDADTIAKDNWIDTNTTKKIAERNEKLKDVPLVDYYNAWIAQKDVEGKKNFKGETISGTKKQAKIKAINEAVDDDLTSEQKKILYGIFNVD